MKPLKRKCVSMLNPIGTTITLTGVKLFQHNLFIVSGGEEAGLLHHLEFLKSKVAGVVTPSPDRLSQTAFWLTAKETRGKLLEKVTSRLYLDKNVTFPTCVYLSGCPEIIFPGSMSRELKIKMTNLSSHEVKTRLVILLHPVQ